MTLNRQTCLKKSLSVEMNQFKPTNKEFIHISDSLTFKKKQQLGCLNVKTVDDMVIMHVEIIYFMQIYSNVHYGL